MSRENALLDTREKGASTKVVNEAGSMKTVIREQGAQILSVKRQQRANREQI